MDPIKDAIREAFLPALFGGEEVSADIREILGHSMKRGGLGIPDPRLLAEHVYITYKESSEVLIGSLLGGTDLNYIEHKCCVRRSSADGRKQQDYLEIDVITRRKDLADGAGVNCI